MSALTTGQVAPVESDDRLVAATRCGDDRAFGELYSRYGRRIVSYIFGMLGDHARAEDIGQEVFISALRRMRATERPIAFKPWIYEIARNACIDEFRRTRRAQEVPLDPGDEPDGSERRLESRMGSPHAALERRQQLDDLRGAFRGLSESHHKIIVLRELEGLSYKEIGRRMGMTRPVVESTLFRARRRLGAEYDEIASGRRCGQVHAVIDAGGEKAVRALGLRERRRVARHVAHCQPCRRYVHLAGVDDSVLKGPGLAEKIAALLPIPAFLRRRGATEDTASSGHSAGLLQSMPTVAQVVDPASPVLGWGSATAAIVAAAVVAAGGLAGSLVAVGGGSAHAKPEAAAVHVSSGPGVGSGGSSSHAPVAASPPIIHAPAKPSRGTSDAGTGGGGRSQPTATPSASSGTASHGSTAQQASTGIAANGTRETTSSSQTSGSVSASTQAPTSSSPALPQLPQPPSGQSGSPLPPLPQPPTGQSGSPLPPVNAPQPPQPPSLNVPSPPSVGNVTDTVHNLLP